DAVWSRRSARRMRMVWRGRSGHRSVVTTWILLRWASGPNLVVRGLFLTLDGFWGVVVCYLTGRIRGGAVRAMLCRSVASRLWASCAAARPVAMAVSVYWVPR